MVPRRRVYHRGVALTEMDIDAVLARASRGGPGRRARAHQRAGIRHEKRWQDVDQLLAAGIDVITTVNIQHLESLNDVVEAITGVPAARDGAGLGRPGRPTRSSWSTWPPRPCAGGWRTATSTPPSKVDAALGNYFRVGNLTALRELALLWVADKVDEALQPTATSTASTSTWETRERVVVALTGGPEGETLIRRAARIAARSAGGDLLGVHVTRSDGLTGASPADLAEQRRWSRPWAAATTRSSATTSRRRCWSSRAPRTPPSSCSGSPPRPAVRPARRARHRQPATSADPATSTSTW